MEMGPKFSQTNGSPSLRTPGSLAAAGLIRWIIQLLDFWFPYSLCFVSCVRFGSLNSH